MRRARFVPPILLLLLGPLTLRAQWQASADLGASHLQRTNIPQSGAATFGASVTGIGDRSWIRSSLLGVFAGPTQATMQGLLAGSIATSPDRKARGELSGVLSGFGETGSDATVSGELMPRVQFGSSSTGVAVGLGLGSTARSDFRDALYRLSSDAWWSVGDDQFAATASAVRTSLTFIDATTKRVSIPRSYADLTGGWRRDRGGVAIGATAGVRGALKGSTGGAWAEVDATAWMFPRTAIVMSGGRTLEDPVRGIPRTTFVSVALRVTAQPHQTIARRPEPVGARVLVHRLDEARRRIEIRGVSGSRVEVMGDFTDWTPVALELAGDVWSFERTIAPGLHRIALRVDGGEWSAPVNLPRATDDLGGVVGLITVP